MTDVYVIGSGPTLDYIDPAFFYDKDVVAVNSAAERLGLHGKCERLTTFTHYHSEAVSIVDRFPGATVFAPEGDRGFAGQPKPENLRPSRITYMPHQPTDYDFRIERITDLPPGGVIVGSTSAHGAMHLASKGDYATSVILVGMDCGRIDGQANMTGYRSGDLDLNHELTWLRRWNDHLEQVKRWLEATYRVRIYSLNPFVNLNLEGHSWEGAR